MSQFNEYLRKLLSLPREKQERIEARLRENDPEGFKRLTGYLKSHPGAVHEAQGYEHLLRRIGQHTFTRPFAPVQHKFWEWNWNALQKVQDKEPLEPREKVGFLPWPRETGKSSTVEWACILEGALLKSGYVIYLCGKLSQAIDHVVAIRDRIESEKVAELYPWLGKPKLGTHGNRFGWGQEFLMTGGGWAIRPVGADVAMRGGKAINIRPTLIVPDDYDELDDSPHVVEHKEHMLTRAILPMGDANTRVLVPQNPIHANSVVNRMLTGASLALAIRTVFGEINDDGTLSNRPIPAVKGLVYEIRQADEGPYSVITQGESNWDGISIADWESTLNRVGPPAFEAEYQHNLDANQEERVLPEYDDRKLLLHVISWDMFEKLYGTVDGMRRIPPDWPCDLGLDLGYTSQHPSSWSFMAKVPEGYPLAGAVFRYRGRNFINTSVDEQSISVRRDMWPGEEIQRQWSSHEKLGERLLLAQKHGWHFHPCDSSKEAGWQVWRHYLRCDRTQPHPFHVDTKDTDTGLWKLGRPAFFDIVVHSQLRHPVDDLGLKQHRDSAFNHRRRPVKLKESGYTVDQPIKAGDDPNDSSRMVFSSPSFGPASKPMTQQQRLNAIIPQGYHRHELEQTRHPNEAQMTSEMAEWFARRVLKKPQQPTDYFGQPLR
jgi:hypothetical protein